MEFQKSNSRFGTSPKKRFSADELVELWEEYKAKCDNETKKVSAYDSKLGKYVTDIVPAPISYSISGFCCFIHMARSGFDRTYVNSSDEVYSGLCECMLLECQENTKANFEKGYHAPALAKIFMHNFKEYKEGTEDTAGQVVIAPMYGKPPELENKELAELPEGSSTSSEVVSD